MSSPRRSSEWVTLQADARPDAPAVVGPDATLSYGQLDDASNRLAHLLQAFRCGTGDRVALLARKSARAVTSLVAVYKSGAVLVPLDAGSPAPRLAKILASCSPRILLAGPGTAGRLAELRRSGALEGIRIGWLGDGPEESAEGAAEPQPDFDWSHLATSPARTPPLTGAARLAHILYTSGSTGEPKGVTIPHAGVVHFIEWAVDHFQIQPGERLSQQPPMHFDISFLDTFGAFAAGASLHLVPTELNILPHRLAEFIRSSELTQWFSVPSLLTYLMRYDAVAENDFPALRRLLWAGEVFPTAALMHWMDRLPHVAFANLYGPTETTIASTYYDVPARPDDPRQPVPIGRACAGEELLILDDDRRPVAVGEIGELHIRGVGLADGYWGDAERTAGVFLPDVSGRPGARMYRTGDLARADASGLVHLIGRADFQIKSRGYRIEPGEIEQAIAATGLAQEAVVTAIASDGFENQSLCCAYVPSPEGAADPLALRAELGRRLPAYMLPAHWLSCEILPRNGNGKLDRRQVKERFEELHGHAATGARSTAGG